MARPGTLHGKDLEGEATSGLAALGSVLMATGTGRCFWLFLQEIVDMIEAIDAGDAGDEFSLIFDGGSASDSFPDLVEGGAAA